jgi:MerR family transcriptional regulator, light-induced transcriptional regulator
MSLSKNPAYNLKVVLQETNLAADTLRAWERRYGLPMPQRTAGGHRLYSQYDIETVKWLVARQAQGLSISRAVETWNEKVASGEDPLAGGSSPSTFAPAEAKTSHETSLDALRARWLSACLRFNEARAEETLNQAFAVHPIESVCTDVLQNGLAEIGLQWQKNQISVQQEHFTSALAIRSINNLISATPAPIRAQTILVGCPAKEHHTFTPLLTSLFLRRRGFNVIYLGANIPQDRFEETVKAVRADLVILVAQQLITAATLQETARLLSENNIPVAYGGRIFGLQPQLIPAIPGFFLGSEIQEAVEQIEDLATSNIQNPQAAASSAEYEKAASLFQSHRSNIDAAIHQSAHTLDQSHDAIKTATEFLGDNIVAALQLGDISLVDGEFDWVKSLIKAHGIPEAVLTGYIKLYAEAVQGNLHDSATLVSDWLNLRAAKN